MLEKELLSLIDQNEFEEKLKQFSQKFGPYNTNRRLSIQITDYNRQDLDTRIRITNGQTKIMQKIGDWTSDTRQELEVDFVNNAEEILKLYKLTLNLLNSQNVETLIIQMNNYIFENDKFELKLTHQKGKQDKYNYEIEVFDHNDDPYEIANKLGLKLDLPENTIEYWKKWNKEVNINIKDLSEDEFLAVVSDYL